MASVIVLVSVFIVTCICAGHTSREFVNVQCKTVNAGTFGQQSLLDCVIKTSQEVSDPKILIVKWMKVGDEEPLLFFDRGLHSDRTGYKFADPHWDERNMNVSLLITNTAVAHEGAYNCMVFTDSGDNKGTTSLTVTAQYNKPTVSSIPDKIGPNDEATLVCNCTGGYPKGQLRWIVDLTTDWTKGSEMHEEQDNSSLYHLSSKLRLMQGSIFSDYTCIVFNASGGKEGEATFQPDPAKLGGTVLPSENHSKIVAPVVVIGSLIVGLLLLLFIRRRSQKIRRLSQVPFLQGHSKDGHEVVRKHDVEADSFSDENGARE